MIYSEKTYQQRRYLKRLDKKGGKGWSKDILNPSDFFEMLYSFIQGPFKNSKA